MTKTIFQKVMSFINGKFKDVNSQLTLNKSSLGLQRKNLLKNTLKIHSSSTITFTTNDDGSITVAGTAPPEYVAPMLFTFTVPFSSNYILSGCPYGGGTTTTGGGYLATIRPASNQNTILATDTGNGVEVFLQAGTNYHYSITIYRNFVSEKIFYPMLRCAEIPDNIYEPYVEDLQTQLNTVFGPGKVIPDNADLDDYIATGSYYSPLAANSATMSNTPFIDGGFRLEVRDINKTSSRLQTLIGNSTAHGLKIYMRVYRNDIGWTKWNRLQLTEETSDNSP